MLKPTEDIVPTSSHHEMPFTRLEIVVLSVIEGQLEVLLGRRAQAPYQGRWALPGGVLRIDQDKDLDAAARRVGLDRLGVELPYLRQLTAIGGRSRDPRARWTLSVIYRALVPFEAIDPNPGKRLEALKWVAADEAGADARLAFDHAERIRGALEVTRGEIERLELPFEFLPPAFTLGELQACCEAILSRRLDKSSFRRRLDERNVLEAVEGQMRTGAFRPAQLYQRHYA